MWKEKAIAWAGGGQSNVYSLPTVRLQAVGNALGVNYSLNKQHLGGSAIADHMTDNHLRVRLHRLQFFSPKNSVVGAENSLQSGF
ncbi:MULTISPECIES: hypothetical protein [unclassified Nostoc]|uniref:hypothetical protein n=1 Tax=unclassified Nostoc TaxID=2593658 RepID=UPI002AD35C75|nr:hypothetical protein [Nostoc sp. DedQUE03]MDZ7974047.1 hypothetical protein [Nostoc sp. DedQUE03]MDZ8048548.1 hypothetical protein [Nostoc sp. DedQUE02]